MRGKGGTAPSAQGLNFEKIFLGVDLGVFLFSEF